MHFGRAAFTSFILLCIGPLQDKLDYLFMYVYELKIRYNVFYDNW